MAQCPHYEIIPPFNVIHAADLYQLPDGVIREGFWELFVKYNSVCIGPPRIEGIIIGEMENLETDLVRGEHSRLKRVTSYGVQDCQDVDTLKTKIESSTNKIKAELFAEKCD